MRRSQTTARRQAGAAAALLAAAAAGPVALVLLAHTAHSAWETATGGAATPDRQLAATVELASTALLVAVSCWLSACVVAEIGEQVRARCAGRLPHTVCRRRPEAVRALVAVLLGSALTAPLGAAAQQRPGLPTALDGLPLPDRMPDRTGRVTHVSGPVREPDVLRVRVGDTLWRLAAERLPVPHSALDVDRAWRRLYAHNRSAVGPDPDLLLPGTPLRVPRHL